MPHQHIHCSEQELLMAADGELSAHRADEVKRHLESCWTCRERLRCLEETIADFVRARNHEFAGGIPSAAGPRALLLARMSASKGVDRPPVWRARVMFWRVVTATACVGVLVCGLVFFERTVNAHGPRPNSIVTPGETRPVSLAEVCRSPQAEVVRSIPAETRRQVLASYGINPDEPGRFEVDYLITPDLGGTDSLRNLWPQPYTARWNARVKDKLEQRLHDLVCAGEIDLPTAQREIARDWIGAYKKYMNPDSRH